MKRRSFLLMLVLAATAYLPGQGVAVGTRIPLTARLNLNQGTSGQFAQVFVPDYFTPPTEGRFTLVFHLHSASWAAEDQVYKARADAVLFNIHLGGFSSSYQNYFSNQSRFQTIRDTVVAVLQAHGIISNPVIARTIITAFSAGYAGIREILKVSAYVDGIASLHLADGLHCNSDAGIMALQMADFLSFARSARAHNKVMLITHSSIPTSGYQSTTQTADYLIANLGAQRIPYSANDAIGTQYSRCDTGHFHVRGYYGQTAADHLQHLYNMDLMLDQALRILEGPPAGIGNESQGLRPTLPHNSFPNPFNTTAHLQYQVPEPVPVEVSIHDISGRRIANLLSGQTQSGPQTITWDAGRQSSGIYFYRIRAGRSIFTGKCLLVK